MHSSLHNGTPPPPPLPKHKLRGGSQRMCKKSNFVFGLRLECKGLSDMYHRRNILRFETS